MCMWRLCKLCVVYQYQSHVAGRESDTDTVSLWGYCGHVDSDSDRSDKLITS